MCDQLHKLFILLLHFLFFNFPETASRIERWENDIDWLESFSKVIRTDAAIQCVTFRSDRHWKWRGINIENNLFGCFIIDRPTYNITLCFDCQKISWFYKFTILEMPGFYIFWLIVVFRWNIISECMSIKG